MGVEFGREAGVVGVGLGDIGGHFALGHVVLHLQVAEPFALRFLCELREIFQARAAVAVHPGETRVVDFLDALGLRAEVFLDLGDLAGGAGFRGHLRFLGGAGHAIATTVQVTDQRFLALGEAGGGLPEGGEEVEGGGETQVGAVTHNHSSPSSKACRVLPSH